jgi:hypothetical protein
MNAMVFVGVTALAAAVTFLVLTTGMQIQEEDMCRTLYEKQQTSALKLVCNGVKVVYKDK